MLMANAVVYSSQQGYLDSVRMGSAQVQESEYASILSAASGFSVLAEVQSFLQSTPMDCSTWQAYLASIVGTSSDAGSEQGISYSAGSSWTYLQRASTSPGDSLIPREFDGYVPGDLNVEVTMALTETYVGGLPSYSTQNTEALHIDVQPETMATECLSALSELRDGLSSLASCNSSLISQALSLARTTYSLLGSLATGASASVAAGRCMVSYWVRMSQAGTGVSGTFEWTAVGSGSVETGAPIVSPPSAT